MKTKILSAVACALVLTACGEQSLRPERTSADQLAAQGDYNGALQYYRTALAESPDDADLRRGYLRAAEEAVNYSVTEARRAADTGDFATADARLAQGLFMLPDSELLNSERARIKDLRTARKFYNDAVASAKLGRVDRAMREVERALSLDPEHGHSIRLLNRLTEADLERGQVSPIRLRTGAPVTLSFREAGFKEALLSLGQAYGVNMIFDTGVQNLPVTLFAEDVTFVQAFELLLKSNRAFYRRLGKNSVVIAPDTAEARAQYEDYLVRTFYLQSGDPTAMGELISRSIGTQNVTVNQDAKTVTIRDSRERVALAAKLIDANDLAPAEVILEVEVLEVNRNKSEQLGLDFGGSQISVTPSAELVVREFNSLDDIGRSVNNSALTLPAASLRFFKQDVDAKILASPSIRTLDKQEASLHIGDEVPLRSSTIQDATGQTRTTFEYRDIGIRLIVTPEVNLNRSVTVGISLEVSSLGNNLGTTDEPAFAIGTRNVETRMVLDDTETAIIGGLIRDEERNSVQSVPGLGRTSAVGRLFSSRDGSGNRTDILLTLRPLIVRGRDVPGPADAEIFSGSGARVTTERNLDFLASTSSSLPTIRLDLSGTTTPEVTAGLRPPVALSTAPTSSSGGSGSGPSLAFARSVFETSAGETLDVAITGSGFAQDASGTLTIRYRPDLVEAIGVRTAGELTARIDNSRGEIEIDLDNRIAGGSTRDIGTLSFRAVEQGLSYLLFSNNFGTGPTVNIPDNVELRSSRIIIR